LKLDKCLLDRVNENIKYILNRLKKHILRLFGRKKKLNCNSVGGFILNKVVNPALPGISIVSSPSSLSVLALNPDKI
jgi:hypothetical protein